MRSEFADNHRCDLMCRAFIAIALLLGALVLAKATSYVRTQRAIARVRSLTQPDPNDLQESLRKAKDVADALKKANLFAKQPPKEHPVKQVDGILGNEALIAGNWYKAGEKVGDAEILAVAATEITVGWNGQKKVFAPMAAASAETPPVNRPEPPKPPEPAKATKAAAPVEVKKVEAPAGDDPLAWMGITLSPKARAKLLEIWNKVPDDQKEQAKEQWNKMSDEDKQKALDAMENM
jgi:hypothetical protein